MAKPVSPVIDGYESFEVSIAESQDEYGTLPALMIDNKNHTLITRWEFNDEEIGAILHTKSVYILMSTFGNPIQPLAVTAIIQLKENNDN